MVNYCCSLRARIGTSKADERQEEPAPQGKGTGDRRRPMMARRAAIITLFCGSAHGLVLQCPAGPRPGAWRAGAGVKRVDSMRPNCDAGSSRAMAKPVLITGGHNFPAGSKETLRRRGAAVIRYGAAAQADDGDAPKPNSQSSTTGSISVEAEGLSSSAAVRPEYERGPIPKFDKLDKTILLLSLPAIVNFMLVPLVGAADTFWVGKMSNAAALAGTGAANRIYSTTFWVLGFLPSVITPLVAQAYGAKDMEGVQRHIGEALFLSLVIGMLGCALVTLQSARLLGIVIPPGAPAMAFAVPYFLCRGISFLPAMLSTVGFATFRGTLDTVTPLAIRFTTHQTPLPGMRPFVLPMIRQISTSRRAAALARCPFFPRSFPAEQSSHAGACDTRWKRKGIRAETQ
jgi:hypothetical protein